ncbi:Protein YbiU [Escherichia coli]
MASTFTSDTLPADHKAAIRQMKHALRAQLGDVQQIFNQLSDDIATRVAEINALKAQAMPSGRCCLMPISKQVMLLQSSANRLNVAVVR